MMLWQDKSPFRCNLGRGASALAGLLCGLLGALPLAATPAAAQLTDIDTPRIMPFDVGQDMPGDPVGLIDQKSVYNFMWETFVAMNWPQDPNARARRAEPQVSGDLAPWGGTESMAPTVWQSYLRPGQIFLPPDGWSVTWDEPDVPVTCSNIDASGFLVISPNNTNYSDSISDGMNQPFTQATYSTGPIIDQNGNYLRFEVGLNEAYFTYIAHYKYYIPWRQKESVRRFINYVKRTGEAPPKKDAAKVVYFQPLPNGTEGYLQGLPDYALQGIAEWKAAWKILDGDDDPKRFFRQTVVFLNPDGTCTDPVTAGLVGFHIHRVTPNFNHIGATFEHVDNTLLQPAYSSSDVAGAEGLPAHASLNPGTTVAPIYGNGYQVCDSEGNNCEEGIGGNLPPLVQSKAPLPPSPPIVNVARQVPIPDDVQEVNAEWRARLEGKALFYYQLIGTQNRNQDEPNPNLGPGTLGSQVSNTNDLINTTLESYTQKGWSCALCHQNATPLGVGLPLPPFSKEYEALRTISFLLQGAVNNQSSD